MKISERASRALLPVLLLILLESGFSPAAASPWPRRNGELFLATRTAYFLATADEPLAAGSGAARFERFDSDNYFEFGLTRAMTLGGKAVYGTSTWFDGVNGGAASGFSEIEGFAQYEVSRGANSALSVKLAVAAPRRLVTGARPELANDGVDTELRALYGRNIMTRPVKIFAAAEAGYRRRFGQAADQMRAEALVGVEPAARLLLLFEIHSTLSLRNEGAAGADYDVLKLQPSLVWRLTPRFSLQGGLAHETAARNLLAGDTFFVGLWSFF